MAETWSKRDYEILTAEISKAIFGITPSNENSQGVKKLNADAKAGGDIAGGARKKLEKRLKKSVVSKKNFLN